MHKVTKHLSEEDLNKMLDAIAEEDDSSYLEFLTNVLKHSSFRKLSEEFITQRFTDIERAEEKFSFKLENIIDLDNYPGVKLLKKLK